MFKKITKLWWAFRRTPLLVVNNRNDYLFICCSHYTIYIVVNIVATVVYIIVDVFVVIVLLL